ncbi:MAG: SDR family oxidoreductase [Deltaproteobacteria bacterium]|nr:SDR family oxidoreductase [Deltaproteobacteria bacterium]MBN2672064.1 SDR family oxidoreductase [Deltaproteobacteria bacterium]
MKIIVLGASGATGRHVTDMLLRRGHQVTIIVRSVEKLPESFKHHRNLTTIAANLLELSDQQIASHVRDCDAVASCLGHNISFTGMYGHPRKLVVEAERRFCEAIKKTSTAAKPVKFVLMNSSGVSNRDLSEPISFGQKLVIGMLRLLLPPHKDNEMAADYLRTQIGQNNKHIEWTAVRPDGLIDEEAISPYKAVPSPTRSSIFDAGQISRINVAHFMSELINDDTLWNKWKGQMPVLYRASET